MVKSKFAKLIDGIFIIIGTLSISFYVFRFYITSLPLLILISICISISVIAVSNLIFGIKNKEKREKTEIGLFFEKLIFLGKNRIFEELKNALSAKKTVRTENGLLITESTAFANCLNEKLTLSLFAEIYANAHNLECKKLIILCPETHKQIIEYCKRIDNMQISVLEGKECYHFLKWLGFKNPDVKFIKKQKGFIKNFANILSPDKASRYFSLFIFFLGFSFILQNSVYYIVFASILLTLSIISKSNIIEKIKK